MNSTRRDALLLGALFGTGIRPAAAEPAVPILEQARDGQESIAFLIYPGFVALDLFGPHAMLWGMMPRSVDLVAATRDPVPTDTGVAILPSKTFGEVEPGLDVLCVPGGEAGTLAAMRDAATLDFLRRQGESARWVTSVCTGSFLLGAAGLLRGYRATSHWAVRDVLAHMGAIPTEGRVVQDRNRMTGGGVTAGIDFGLTLVEQFRTTAYAQAVQLSAEYDPQPPFHAGSPDKAPAPVAAEMRAFFAGFARDSEAVAREAGARLR